MNKRVVITGPTGAIGMALIEECIRNDSEAVVICHKGSKRNAQLPVHPAVKIIEADLDGLKQLDIDDIPPCDVFYHLAWRGTTGNSRNDMALQTKNIQSILDAVELAERLGCHTFIGAGSQAEYGRVEGVLRSDTPTFPENGYGMAKLCAGQMSRVLCEQKGIRHIWARILSVYGPWDGENSMVSSTVQRLLMGEHASFTPGEQLWDYLYSGDAARTLWLLAEKGHSGNIYVLGSGQAKPLKEYIGMIAEAVQERTGRCGSLGIGELTYGERQVMYLKADIGALTADTGFVPETEFAEGIRKVLDSLNHR